MATLGGSKGELQLSPTSTFSVAEKVLGIAAGLFSAVAVYKGIAPSVHHPFNVNEAWFLGGLGVGGTTYAYFSRNKETVEQTEE